MDKQGFVMFLDKGLGDAQLPNTDYQIIKKEFDRLCDDQESLYKPEFEAVFMELHKLDTTLTNNYPCTMDEALLDEALKLAGFETDEAFCVDFKKYNALFVEGKALQAKGLGLQAQYYAQNHQKYISVEGWQFVPISIVGNTDIIKWVDEIIMNDAQEGKGLFANHFQIPKEDELLDKFLCVEVYGLKCSFVLFLDELKMFGVVDGQNSFFGKEQTHILFRMLNMAANYLKEHTEQPQAIKNKIARLVNSFDNIPIWGIFFQILMLQGLCRLLKCANINEGDDGYNEVCSLYRWLYLELIKKEIDFCYKPYGEKDRERLKPLCAYLMSTEVGQLVQSRLFGNEPQPEQANNGQTADAQSLNPAPQHEKPKPTRGRGRPKETLKDKMIDDANGEKLQRMHDVLDGKKGKDTTLIILACIKKGWMTKPTYTQVKNEFGDIGSKTGYNRYLNENMFTKEELDGAINSLD